MGLDRMPAQFPPSGVNLKRRTQTGLTMESNTQEQEQKIYRFYGKEYVLSKELVKGGCQGCAFYAKIDCHKRTPNQVTKTRAQICNEEHKIFKRLIKS